MMRKIIFAVFGVFIFVNLNVYAQVIAPVPIAEIEVRENSIRMRSNELERIRRENRKPKTDNDSIVREIKFAEVKENFENIQKIQNSIVKVYTTGKTINYEKISELAENLKKNALKLDVNLFGERSDATDIDKKSDKEKSKRRDVKILIVDLDNSIGEFIKNPIFQNLKIVDSNDSKKAQKNLKRIMDLSDMLSEQAKNINK